MKRTVRVWVVLVLACNTIGTTARAAARPELTELKPEGNAVVLHWTDVGADAYQIWRAGSLSGTYQPIGRTEETTYKDSGLRTGAVYYYKVRAVMPYGYGMFSEAEGRCCVQLVDAPAVQNPCYRQNKTIAVQGLMLHSVGCPQEKASVFAENWNRSDAEVLVHAVIDPSGSVWQLADWDMRCWHCGGAGNDSLIGVEMTEPNELRYLRGDTFVWNGDAAETAIRNYNTAVALFAGLCLQYDLDPITDICSHREGGNAGNASDHGDPEHLWRGLGLELDMDTFRQDVNRMLLGAYRPRLAGKTADHVVTVTAGVLNVRSGPGTGYGVTGQIFRGERVAICETREGQDHTWGKLFSGDWISLTYTSD